MWSGLAKLRKGGSSRNPIVMWNFSGTPGGGTWLSPGQTISLEKDEDKEKNDEKVGVEGYSKHIFWLDKIYNSVAREFYLLSNQNMSL